MIEQVVAQRERLLGFVRQHVNSPADAEDIVHSALLRLVEKAETVNDHESVSAWIYRVLRNAIIDHYRRRAANERAHQTLARNMRELEEQIQFDLAAKNRPCPCLWSAMATLKPQYRDALNLVDVEQRSLGELAESSGISKNNAAVRVHRARQSLRERVQITCGICATHGCVDCRCPA